MIKMVLFPVGIFVVYFVAACVYDRIQLSKDRSRLARESERLRKKHRKEEENTDASSS